MVMSFNPASSLMTARLKVCVGLNIDVHIDFVKNNEVTLEYLKEKIVTEVLMSSVTTLDNGVSMPCATEFPPNGGKTGEAMSASLLSTVKKSQDPSDLRTLREFPPGNIFSATQARAKAIAMISA